MTVYGYQSTRARVLRGLCEQASGYKAIDSHTFDTDNGLCLDDDITCILESVWCPYDVHR